MLQVNYGSHLNNGWYWDRTYSGTRIDIKSYINAEKDKILYGKLICIEETATTNNVPKFLARRCEGNKKLILKKYLGKNYTDYYNDIEGYEFVGYISVGAFKENKFSVNTIYDDTDGFYLYVSPDQAKSLWNTETDLYTLDNNQTYSLVDKTETEYDPYTNYYKNVGSVKLFTNTISIVSDLNILGDIITTEADTNNN